MKKPTDENKLSTKFPDVAKSWHPTKNNILTPNTIACYSNKKFWWICNKGHEWKCSVASRTNCNSNCPYCSGRLVLEHTSLSFLRPDVVKSWHPTKNNTLTPKDVTCCSTKKCWWICEKDHEWKIAVYARTNGNSNCPYCTSRLVCDDNSLENKYPDIAKSWHPTKNNTLTPKDVTFGTNKKFWWICEKGHEWKVAACSRTSGNSNCPYCANQKVCNENSLKSLFPKISKEWHPTKNNILTPKDVTFGTNKKFWWICKKGHEWKTSCANRTNVKNNKKGTKCPYCTNQKVCNDNSLKSLFPDVAKSWHPTKNNTLTPKDVLSGSAKTYWWICEKGHEWKTSCSKRTNGGFYKEGTNCPVCKSSMGENKIAEILKNNKIKFERQAYFKDCRNKLPLRFDFKIQNIFIEFQGQQHYYPVCFGNINKEKANENYLNTVKSDKIKKEWCKKNKMKLYTISYLEYSKIEKIINKIIKQHQIQQDI